MNFEIKFTWRRAAVWAAVAVATFQAQTVLRGLLRRRRLLALRAQKQAELRSELEELRSWVDSDRDCPRVDAADLDAIRSMSVQQLHEAMLAKRWPVVYVLKATYEALLAAHERTNCVVGLCLGAALEAARAAQQRIDTGRLQGLALAGVPVSIKDNIDVCGMDSTIGAIPHALQPASADSGVVRMIRRAGGIIIAKTNVPQTLLSYESWNELFGECRNPVGPKFTCGGSSGGEAALIALGGSAAGIGSDIGGSIRIPAHFCGIFGLKPSQFRVPNAGQRSGARGQEGVSSVLGPMARSVEDLTTVFRVLVDGAAEIDGLVMNVPFREELHTRFATKECLRVAYYTDDGIVAASPACRRAVQQCVVALRAAGHDVVELHGLGPLTTGLLQHFYWLVGSDGGEGVHRALAGDKPSPFVRTVLAVVRLPTALRRVLASVAKLRSPLMGEILADLGVRSVFGYFSLLNARNDLRHHYAAMTAGFDFVLAPGLVFPAPPLRSTTALSYGAAYTAIHNVLDTSVVAVPVTTVDAESDVWLRSELASAPHPFLAATVHKTYDARAQHGLPVGVQVICPRFSEEQALACAQRLVNALENVQ